jgi:hypothetical protein
VSLVVGSPGAPQNVTVPNGRATTIDSNLTAAGRNLLAAIRAELKITAVASFAPFVGNEVTVTNRITFAAMTSVRWLRRATKLVTRAD